MNWLGFFAVNAFVSGVVLCVMCVTLLLRRIRKEKPSSNIRGVTLTELTIFTISVSLAVGLR